MPRINEYKDKYLKTDFIDYIYNEMRHLKKSQREMGEKIGTTQQSFSRKLQKADFDFSELVIIFRELGTPSEKIVKLMGG